MSKEKKRFNQLRVALVCLIDVMPLSLNLCYVSLQANIQGVLRLLFYIYFSILFVCILHLFTVNKFVLWDSLKETKCTPIV